MKKNQNNIALYSKFFFVTLMTKTINYILNCGINANICNLFKKDHNK